VKLGNSSEPTRIRQHRITTGRLARAAVALHQVSDGLAARMGKMKSKSDAVGDGTADIPQALSSIPHVCGVIRCEQYASVPRADDHA
jgi:hypothetical protein